MDTDLRYELICGGDFFGIYKNMNAWPRCLKFLVCAKLERRNKYCHGY